jgi:hypothetical protein
MYITLEGMAQISLCKKGKKDKVVPVTDREGP